MDDKWLELWGNFLIQAARNQRASRDFFHWLSEGAPTRRAPDEAPGLAAWMRMFVPFMPADFSETETNTRMDETARQWQTAFREWVAMMGVVSKREYDELVERCERLEAKLDEKEETIRQLGQLLALKSTFDAGLTTPLQEMLKSQGEAFQKMMQNCFGVTSTSTHAKGNEQDDGPESTD